MKKVKSQKVRVKIYVLCFVFFILYFANEIQAVNDFSADANCVPLWCFENGALTTDSKGGNTLSAHSTPSAETADYKEGAASVYLNEPDSEYFDIADADLDAGFSFEKISICTWFKVEAFSVVDNYNYFFCKYSTGKRTYAAKIQDVSGTKTFQFRIGIETGNEWETISFSGAGLSNGVWYHLGLIYQDSDKSYKIRIWDDNASALLGGAEETGNTTNNINIENAPLYIGTYAPTIGHWDGLLDEFVVFNDILSSAEIDEIRSGTYPAVAGGPTGQLIIVEME